MGGTRVAAVTTVGTTTKVLWYHDDHLGGTNVITDSLGAKKEVIEYSPFGEFSRRDKYGSSEETAWYYFTGKPYDDETGLIYFGARYYDPRLGRFITADTIVQDPYDPQTLNRYSYTSNNPINRIDPDGHKWSWKKFWKSFVGAFVGVLTAIFLPVALPWIGATMAGMIGGAVGGALTGGLEGGWRGAMFGALGGAALGGFGGWGLDKFGWGFGVGMLAAGAGVAGATNSWDSFAGGLAGGVFGAITGNAVLSNMQSAANGGAATTDSKTAEVVQESVSENPQDLQGAIDAGRAVGGESGAMAAGSAVGKTSAEAELFQSFQKMGVSYVRGKVGEVQVDVPFGGRGAIFKGRIMSGGGKGVAARAANSLAVAAKVTGKMLGGLDVIKYSKGFISAFSRGDMLTGFHDFGRAGFALLGVLGMKNASVIGEGVDGISKYLGAKIYGVGP